MEVEQIKEIANRHPFRPFTIRLSNGASYAVREARDFGAPRDPTTIFYFGGASWLLIDPTHVVEIIDKVT